jgi:hypothetical protein
LIAAFVAQHREELRDYEGVDPEHVAATIAGATIFFVAGLPVFVDTGGFDPLTPEHLAVHRSAVLQIVHKLMVRADTPKVGPRAADRST